MRTDALKNRVVRAAEFLRLYRLISLLIIASLVTLCVPPAIAASAARNAFSNAKARVTSIGSEVPALPARALQSFPLRGPYGFLVSNWARSLGRLRPTPPQRRERRGVRPRAPETRAERELRVARLRLNPSGHVRMQSRQPMLFTAIPTDAEGNSIHGLQAAWNSSDRRVIFIRPDGHAVAGMPGKATLTATAGSRTATVNVVVVENSSRQRFGAEKPTSTRRGHSIGTRDSKSSDNQSTAASVINRQTSRSNKSQPKSKHHPAPKSAMFVPQRPPTEDPLPDDETPSLYEPGNLVGSPPGKTKPGAKSLAVATNGTESGNQNFTFGLPIVGLPGRGIDVSLALVYNSQLWNKSTDPGTSSTWMTFDVDSGWTGPGFRLGYGQIENQGSFGFTLTEADGTRRQLTYVTGTTFEANDGSFIRYVGGSAFGTLYYPDGTIVSYGAGGGGYRLYPTRITDRNGNYILISYAGTNGVGPKISSILDTLERYITFHYASNGDLVTITAPGLGTTDRQMMRFYYADITLGSGLFDSSVNATVPETIHTLQYVYLPTSADGTDPHIGYKFEYSPYGMIRQVTQFRGMTVSSDSESSAGTVTSDGTMAAQTTYGYPTSGQSLTDVPKFDSRSDDWAGRTSGGSAPAYTFGNSTATGVKISTVTAPDSTVVETHTIDNPESWDDGLVKQTLVKHGSTAFFNTVIDWENPSGVVRMAAIRVTDDGSLPQTKATVFGYGSYNNVTMVSERAFTADGSISATELRRTELTYITSSAYINRRLLHLPESVKVFEGGSSTPASHVDYAYDNYGTNHANLTARNDIIMHDPAFDPFQETQESCDWVCYEYDPWWVNCINEQWVCNYYNPYDPNTDYRGNVTSVTTYADAATTSGAITQSTTYDIAGNIMAAHGDCCQLKAFTYSGAGENGDHDYAYVISMTDGNPSGLHLTTEIGYDYNTGLVGSITDANSHVTTNYFNPDSLRPDHVTYPDGGAVYFTYGDGLTADANGKLHSYVQTSTKLDNNGSGGATRYLDAYQYFDGRGAVARALSSYTATNGWHTQDIEYDNMGRAYRSSNTYYSSGSSSAINPEGFWTTSTFDRLGRVTQVAMPRGDNDNSLTTSAQISYDGIYTTFTNQAGKVRRQKVDALGRVIRLDEPTASGLGSVSSPNQKTEYFYDALNNLVRIYQGDQNRYYKYDSLSRLIRERQVEQDTNSSYDLSDVLTGNSSWSRKIEYNSQGLITHAYDARGLQTSFSYDALSRLTTVNYSDSTPDVFYYYDNQSLPSGAPSYTHSNTIGRLLAMTYGSSTSITGNYFAYDARGNVTTQKQVTGSTVYGLSYTYNHAGMLSGETYPSNRALVYSYDEGGRLSQVSDGTTTFASGFQFADHGGLKSETFGNGMVHALEYNRRLQASQVKLSQTVGGTTTVLQQYDYGYGTFNSTTGAVDTSKNNGQIGSITGKINGTTQWLQGFSYDELGRLSNVAEYQSANMSSQTYSHGYTYERYGNRFQSANATLGLPAVTSSEIVAATNRFINTGATPTTYDEAGNITVDTKFRNLKYEYDANGRQRAAKLLDNTTLQTSIYDCAGKRVQSTANGVTRTMVYDVFGKNVADYTGSSGTTLERENIYRGGQLLATETLVTAAPSALAAYPSASNVALSWTAASGAANYRVERKAAGSSYSSIGTTASTSFTDNSAAVGSAYLYRVCAADGGGNCTSGYTNIGFGARVNFPTDPTITSIADDPTGINVTTMKAAHIIELRTAVNAVRSLAGLPAATWTHQTLTPFVTDIRKEDVNELRTKLNEALTALGVRTSDWIDHPLAGAPNGTLIRGVQITQLRQCATNGSSCYKPIAQFVKDFYQGALHRQPTPGELSTWTATLEQAQRSGQLLPAAQSLGSTLFNSAEYAGFGTSNAQFVTDLYTGYLQRTHDLEGHDFWLSILNGNNDRAHLMLAFAGSAEFGDDVSALCAAPATSGGLQYVLSDLQGSTRAIMSNNGTSSTVVARYDFLPFGEEIGAGVGLRSPTHGFNSGDALRWKYAMTERDSTTGLDHTWWRKYENLSGRWTSPDPYAGSIADPQSLNRYSYVGNDPVNFVDPAGLYAACIHEVMTRFMARHTGRSRSLSRRLGGLAGDKPGGADSKEFSVDPRDNFENWFNWAFYNTGPGADIHFASPERIAERVGNFRSDMRSRNYQQAAFTLHAVQDRQPHAGFGRPDGHASAPEVDWTIGDDKFVQAAQDTFEVLGGRGPLTARTIRNLIKEIVKGCGKNAPIRIVPRATAGVGGGPGDTGGGPIGFGGYPSWWYSMWAFVAWVNSITTDCMEWGTDEGPCTGRPTRPPILQ